MAVFLLLGIPERIHDFRQLHEQMFKDQNSKKQSAAAVAEFRFFVLASYQYYLNTKIKTQYSTAAAAEF